MTDIFFPDISAYQGGLVVQPNTAFLWARATMGASQVDNFYQNFKAQAAKLGIPFGAYHFLYAGNGSAQADHAFSVVGKDVPLFVDVESTGTSYPTLADVNAFVARYRQLGGICEAMYYPKWYWSNQGSPSLSNGLKLIASGYAPYSDSSPSWDAYGGVTPFQWQFSDKYDYAGMQVDYNAYKGSLSQYLSGIGMPEASVPIPVPTPTSEDEDMSTTSYLGRAGVSWAAGSKHVIQVTYDPAGGDPSLRLVLLLTTGPWVAPASMTFPAGSGSGVYEIPADYVANCRGVVLEDSDEGHIYDVFVG